jgi:neutral ceramidase
VLTTLGPVGVTHVVIVGLANAYAGYMTTREEYVRQDGYPRKAGQFGVGHVR